MISRKDIVGTIGEDIIFSNFRSKGYKIAKVRPEDEGFDTDLLVLDNIKGLIGVEVKVISNPIDGYFQIDQNKMSTYLSLAASGNYRLFIIHANNSKTGAMIYEVPLKDVHYGATYVVRGNTQELVARIPHGDLIEFDVLSLAENIELKNAIEEMNRV